MAQEDKHGRQRHGHALGTALVAIPLLAAAGLWKARSARPPVALPPALEGERRTFAGLAGEQSYYVSGEGEPLLLVHSINAAGSAYEVKPIYDRYRGTRRVYAMELPGFGFSERSERTYDARLMTNAVLAMAEEIRRERGGAPFDALALSLSCEFLARAATERPDAFRRLAFVSPTGFDKRGPYEKAPMSTRGSYKTEARLRGRTWFKLAVDLLASGPSIRFFLAKTWGSRRIDEGLYEYARITTRQPGVQNALTGFLSFILFSADISRVYENLTQPVWISHGTRGDFTDYTLAPAFARGPHRSISVFETGAFPHFETIDDFARAYDAFLATNPVPALA